MDNQYEYLKNAYGIDKATVEKMSDAIKKSGISITQPKREYFKRVTLDDLAKVEEVTNDVGDTTYSITQKISAQVIDMAEKVIVDAIINTAREAGINDLYLIDKEFIITAIKNEMNRRNPDYQYKIDTRFNVKI